MINKISKFIDSELYIILVFMISFLIWFFEPTFLLCVFIYFILFNFVLFFKKNSNGIFINLLALLVSNIQNLDIENESNLVITIVLLFILFFELIVFYIKNNKHRPMYFLLGLIFINLSFFISGSNKLSNPTSIFYLDSLILLFINFMYIFFVNTLDLNKYYLSNIILYFCLLVSLEIFIWYFTYYQEEFLIYKVNTKWGNGNSASMILLLLFPLTSYLYSFKFNTLYFYLNKVILLALVLSSSRGGILFGIIGFVIMEIYTFLKSNKSLIKKNYLIIGSIALLICLIFNNQVINIFNFILRRFLDLVSNNNDLSSGRFDRYKEAIDIFISSPLIGKGTMLTVSNNLNPWYHSSILDILASLGIIGLVTFGIHFVQKYKYLFNNKMFHFLLGFLLSELYGLIDVNYFNFMYLFIYVLIISTLEIIKI